MRWQTAINKGRTSRHEVIAHSQRKQRLRKELTKFLVMVAYLLVIFMLFQLHEYVVLRQHELTYTRFGFGIVKSLILAKVMLIGQDVNLGKRLSAKPLIYKVVGKSGLFALLFIAFDVLEQALRALFTGRDMIQSISAPGGSIVASIIVATIMWVMLIPYFAFVEIGRVFGVDSVKRLLFSSEKNRGVADEPLMAARS